MTCVPRVLWYAVKYYIKAVYVRVYIITTENTHSHTHRNNLWPPFVRNDAQWAISTDRCQHLIKENAHQPLRLEDSYE